MAYNYNRFTHNIWDSIERFSQDVWVVKSIPNIKCTCIDHSTKQASKSCKKCLGIGTRIKIYKTRAVLREGKEQEAVFSDTTLSSTPKVAYFKYSEVVIDTDDYVVDLEDIYTNLYTDEINALKLRGYVYKKFKSTENKSNVFVPIVSPQ